MAMKIPAMNMMPPMVGVPCLAMCQTGPISLMDCPAFRACSQGIRNLPIRAEAAKATRKLIKYLIFCSFGRL